MDATVVLSFIEGFLLVPKHSPAVPRTWDLGLTLDGLLHSYVGHEIRNDLQRSTVSGNVFPGRTARRQCGAAERTALANLYVCNAAESNGGKKTRRKVCGTLSGSVRNPPGAGVLI